jgi:hypothetical protein
MQDVEVCGFTLTRTGIVPPTRPVDVPTGQPWAPPIEDWMGLGEFLYWIDGAIDWLLADWVNYGEVTYGEMASQGIYKRAEKVAAAAHMKIETVLQRARVGREVPRENRDADLTFTHHRVVSPLPPAEQRTWLQKAKEENWSTDRLRSELKTEGKGDTSCWLLVRCTSAEDLETFSEKLKAMGREVKVP